MINVLMVLTNLSVTNGVASFVMNYYRALNKREICVDFAVYNEVSSPHVKEIKKYNGEIFILPPIKKIEDHLKMCKHILYSKNYDIIHDNTLINSIPLLWYSKSIIPVRIFHCHSTKLGDTPAKNLRNKIFFPILLYMATDYAACSYAAGKALLGRKPFTIIPNLIDAKKFQFDSKRREKIRRELLATDKFVIGTVGRLCWPKNPLYALEIIAEVLRECPEVEYWWIGSGPLEQTVRAHIKMLHIEKQVKLLGNRMDVNELYSAMDCFLLPSRFEGLPIVALEAQAAELPVILSDAITKEVVLSSDTLMCSLSDNPEKWAEKILLFQEKKENRENQKKNSTRFERDVSQAQGKLEKIYLNLLKT